MAATGALPSFSGCTYCTVLVAELCRFVVVIGIVLVLPLWPWQLLEEQDVPFLIREHNRKYQWGCSHCTVWQLR